METDGKWGDEVIEVGLVMNVSSRMRVIIMTDVVYSPFPSHHLFCGGGKPTHSVFVLQMSATELCQAMS